MSHRRRARHRRAAEELLREVRERSDLYTSRRELDSLMYPTDPDDWWRPDEETPEWKR